MATNNAGNISDAGLVRYNGTGLFTGVTVTQFDVLVGAAGNGITSVAPTATVGVPLISQNASSNPIFGTALVAGGGTGAVTFNTNGVVISNTSGTGVLSALTLTSGQIVIGGTTTPAAATLTAGTGVTIANGNNTITVNAVGGGLTWTDVTGTSATMAINNGYLADNAGLVTLTLPATATQFSLIRVGGKGAGGWTVVWTTNQNVIFGSKTATVTTGSLSSTNANDCIELLATVGGASTIWTVLSAVGNITVV